MNLDVTSSINYTTDLVKFIDQGFKNIDKIEIFIFPDFLSFYPVSRILKDKKIRFGAQDCFWEEKGAFTGEVSPLFLSKLGCSYVIIGHPERTIHLKEDNMMINKKIKAVLRNKMRPLLLIFQKEKYEDPKKVFKTVKQELLSKLEGISNKDINRVIIVFEPLWAIGTDKTASDRHISEVVFKLRDMLDSEFGSGAGTDQMLMYGGGVTTGNIEDIITLENIDGVGMGRAAIEPDVFKNAIIKVLKNRKF
jgi:triosephosphate isomerase